MSLLSPVHAVLHGQKPKHIVYAPNYWQWFSYHKQHGTMPETLSGINSQLDLIRYLGLDVFSRNLYSPQRLRWYGGIAKEIFEETLVHKTIERAGEDTIIRSVYNTPAGTLSDSYRYQFSGATVIQEKPLIGDYTTQYDQLLAFVKDRRFMVCPQVLRYYQDMAGTDAIVVAGELISPLKLLHILLGPEQTTYFLCDMPDEARVVMQLHEQTQRTLAKALCRAGAQVLMSMDNLDTAFHPPHYVDRYCASYYQGIAKICHEYGAKWMIHACGCQKANLPLIAAYNVDGLEGVAYPPFGDVTLPAAMELTHSAFIITGGISPAEYDRLKSEQAVFDYVNGLFLSMKNYSHRFIFSASCNTPISAQFEQLIWFRNAWNNYKS